MLLGSQELKFNGAVHFPRGLAQAYYEGVLRWREPRSQDSDGSDGPERFAIPGMESADAVWDILLELEADSVLPYKLQDVMDAASAAVQADEKKSRRLESHDSAISSSLMLSKQSFWPSVDHAKRNETCDDWIAR